MGKLLTGIEAMLWPAIGTALVASTLMLFIPTLKRHIALWRLPLVGQGKWNHEARRTEYLLRAEKLYEEGYRKYKAGIFRITTNRESEVVVVGPKYIHELSKHPDSSLSALSAFEEARNLLAVKYTKNEATAPSIVHTVKSRLTPALGRLCEDIHSEVELTLAAEIPKCSDWTDLHFSQHLLRIIGKVAGKVFVGPELGRSDEYIEHVTGYATDMLSGAQAVGRVRKWMRPFRAPHLPEIKRLDDRFRKAEEFFLPVVTQRKKMDPAQQKPDDFLQWLIDVQDAKYGEATAGEITKLQLDLSFAAIHTTTGVSLNTIYTLAVMPEVQRELREEARAVLAENGGRYSYVSVQKLHKLESFVGESLRFYPIGATSFQRKTLRTIVLSDGTVLPEGILVEAPVSAVSRDPTMFQDPDTFDPWRFYKQRKAGSKASDTGGKAQMVGIGFDNLVFGIGRHACPGRFFAVTEMKLILAELLMRYEIRNVDGCEERYPNLGHAVFFDPDTSRHLLLKELVA